MTAIAMLEPPVKIEPIKEEEQENQFISPEWLWKDTAYKKNMNGKIFEFSAPVPASTSYVAALSIQEVMTEMLKPNLPGLGGAEVPFCPCPQCVARREATYVLTDIDLLAYLVKVGEGGNLGYMGRDDDCFLARALSVKYPYLRWRVSQIEALGYAPMPTNRFQTAIMPTQATLLLSPRQRMIVKTFDNCQIMTGFPAHLPVPRALFLDVWNRGDDPIVIEGEQARFVREPEVVSAPYRMR